MKIGTMVTILKDVLGDNFQTFMVFMQFYKNVPVKEIQKIATERFGVQLSKDQCRYYRRDIVSKDEVLKKYEAENKLMEKWNESEAKAQDDTNYAEALFALAQGKIKSSEFEKLAGAKP